MNNIQDILSQAIAKLEAGELHKAEVLLRHVLKAQPQNADAMMFLGILASQAGQPDQAIKLLQRSIAINPDNPSAYFNLGVIFERDNRVADAIATYLRALELKPDNIGALNNLGNCYKNIGESASAIAQYRRALALDPANAEVYRNLVTAKTFREYDDDVRAIERLLADTRLSVTQKYYLHFALGKIYEDMGDYSESFRNYLQANTLKRSTIEYDIESHEQQLEFLEQIFSQENLERIPSSGREDETPLFIIGMPRSGTSLVEQILACHPQVYGAGELGLLKDCISKHPLVVQHGYPCAVLHFSHEDIIELGKCYLDGIRRIDSRALRITDKMPQNFLMLGLIPKIFPKARIIHCRRDPLDTCVSCYTQLFSRGQHYSYDLRELGRYYRSYQRLMAHWDRLIGDFILEIDYESLVADLEGQIKRTLSFCGLAWDDACLSFYDSKRPVRTASATQVKQPIHERSVRRGQRFKHFLNPLVDELEG